MCLNPPTFSRDDSPGLLVRISCTETEELRRQQEHRRLQISAGRHGDDVVGNLWKRKTTSAGVRLYKTTVDVLHGRQSVKMRQMQRALFRTQSGFHR